MLRKLFQKYSLTIAIATLVVLVAGGGLACIVFGLRTGLTVAVIAFVVFDGIGSLWEVLTYRVRQDIGVAREEREQKSFTRGTQDNPTIR